MAQDYTTSNRFRFQFASLNYKDFEVNVQNIPLPNISNTPATVPMAQKEIFYPGESIDFSTITVQCILDEDWNSYYNVYQWLKQNFEVTAGINTEQEVITSDAVFIPMSNKWNPIGRTMKYLGMFPINISPPNFTTLSSDEITFDVEFQFNDFEIV